MKKLTLLLSVLFFASTAAYSLPSFWYSAVAYNTSGQIITFPTLVEVDITINDGTTIFTEQFTGGAAIGADQFGMVSFQVGMGTNSGNLSSVLMKANTFILVKVRPLSTLPWAIVVGAPLITEYYKTHSTLIIGGGTGWSLTGNAGTNPATNFIGTTDGQSLVFRVNNVLAGKLHVSGQNTSYGYNALSSGSLSGPANTAIGYNVLSSNTFGDGNTAIGLNSMSGNTSGSFNVAMGWNTLTSSNGTHNVAIGCAALSNNISGNNNTSVGAHTNVSAGGLSNTTELGFNALATASNQVVLGDANVTSLYSMGAYAATTASAPNMFVNSSGQIMRSTTAVVTTEVDPVYSASSWFTTTNNSANWNTAFGWGNHAGLYAPIAHVGATGAAHGLATGLVAGFMSAADFTKLSGIAAGAEVNVNADWAAVAGDAFILNKPTSLPPSGAAGGDLSGTYPNPSVVNDSHNHTSTTLPTDIVYDADLAAWTGSTNLTTLGTIGTGTWQGSVIGTAYLPTTIVYDGDAAGGDLSGTYPNPSVVDDSHNHTTTTLPTDIVYDADLAAWTGSTNLTTLGTIGTGTWQGSVIGTTYLPTTIVYDGDAAGGDLSGTYPNPNVVDDSHNHTSSTLPASTTYLGSDISLTSEVTGTLPVINGGTGQSAALVAGGVLYGASTTAAAVTPVGTAGQVLTSNGSGAPYWTTLGGGGGALGYGQLYFYNLGTPLSVTSTTFTTITGLTNGIASGITLDGPNGILEVLTTGIYQVDYSLALTTGSASVIEVTISVNGTPVTAGALSRDVANSQTGYHYTSASSAILSLNANDKVRLQIKSTAGTITMPNVSVSMHKF